MTVIQGAEPEKTTFHRLLTRQTALTFEKISAYIEKNPESPDAEAAYRWVFETARKHHWESKALSLAKKYRKRTGGMVQPIASEVAILGYAQKRQFDDALLEWERLLKQQRVGLPTKNWQLADLGAELALEAQIANQSRMARDVYMSLERAFFLNQGIQTFCKTKRARLQLWGQPAPTVSVKGLDGQALTLRDFRGKWVLLDFWATNCPPCLEELPDWKQLYNRYGNRDFEILGVSLDDDADVVREFIKEHNVLWQQSLGANSMGNTAERYHVPTIPALFLIDPEGKIRLSDAQPWAVRRILEKELAKDSQ